MLLNAIAVLVLLLAVWYVYTNHSGFVPVRTGTLAQETAKKENMTAVQGSQITQVPQAEMGPLPEDDAAFVAITEANAHEQLESHPRNMDEQVLARMSIHNKRAKEALDGRARVTKNRYAKYFQDELAENERRDWWEIDQDQVDF